MPRDWANWFVISRVHYIENLVITNLLENNQSVCYIGVQLIINGTNKKREDKVIFYDSASITLYMMEPWTEKLLSCYKVKGFSSLLVCFAFIVSHMMTIIRYIRVDFMFRLLDCFCYNKDFVVYIEVRFIEVDLFHTFCCNFSRAEEYRLL